MMVSWSENFASACRRCPLAAVVYWFLLTVFRTISQRDVGDVGHVGVADSLPLVLIADAAPNAMAGGYDPVGDGLIWVSTILGWNVLVEAPVWCTARTERR